MAPDGPAGREASAGSVESAFQRQEPIRSVREELVTHSAPIGRVIGKVGRVLESPRFFVGLAGLHILWIVANLPWVPWRPWDPYPFTFLATLASVEAPFIALLVLMRQERDRYVEELQGEIDLHLALLIERKATAVLEMLDEVRRALDAPAGVEADLDELKEPVDIEAMMERLREHLKKAGAEPAEQEEEDG